MKGKNMSSQNYRPICTLLECILYNDLDPPGWRGITTVLTWSGNWFADITVQSQLSTHCTNNINNNGTLTSWLNNNDDDAQSIADVELII
jgi:hypothetical protein